ncbi:hypothetical protein [Streptomyces niveus]|uniref:hypothetical protein n=1 Tax=Streptomyces niveus TaxID=193462 RepID=UPI003424FB4C
MKLFSGRSKRAGTPADVNPSRTPLLLLSDLHGLPGTIGYVRVQALAALPGPTIGGDPVELARTPDKQLWATGRARVYVAPGVDGPWAKITSWPTGNISLELPEETDPLIALFAIDPDTGDGDRRARGGWYRVTEQPTRKVLA